MNALAMTAKRYRVADFFELAKPRIALLVVVTAAVGYLAGAPSALNWAALAHLVIGTALSAAGAGALNQAVEKDVDEKMRRTMFRPIPSGRVTPLEAGAFGLGLSVAGCGYLWAMVNGLTATLAALTLLSYLGVYTPLKRVTSLNTVVGAIPGALPPVGGWAAARGNLSLEAWLLFAILFLWQLPHFLAIAWMFRDDYARAGLAMLPCEDREGSMTGRQAALYTLALVPISLAPSAFGLAGWVYFAGAFVLSCLFVGVGVRLARRRTEDAARALLIASVVYLPLLFALLALDRTPGVF